VSPGAADRLANWLRHSTTKSSMMVPNRYAAQVPSPALANASGMMRRAGIVGEISATDWPRTAGNGSAPVRMAVWAGAVSGGARAMSRVPFIMRQKSGATFNFPQLFVAATRDPALSVRRLLFPNCHAARQLCFERGLVSGRPGALAEAEAVAAGAGGGEGVDLDRGRVRARRCGRRRVVVGELDRGLVAGEPSGVHVEHADAPRVGGVGVGDRGPRRVLGLGRGAGAGDVDGLDRLANGARLVVVVVALGAASADDQV